MDEGTKEPARRWVAGGEKPGVWVGRQDREGESLSGWRLAARPGVLDFGFIGW